MKCLYYVVPTLECTHQISDDLHAAGVKDFFLHVISTKQAELKQEHIHAGNYFETLDILRLGLVGAAGGLLVGLLAASLLKFSEPFGPDVPIYVFVVITAFLTLFGSWVGGLTGIATKSKKLMEFQDDIDTGKFLVLVYAREKLLEQVQEMMHAKHPDAEFSTVDKHFINPFSIPHRVAIG